MAFDAKLTMTGLCILVTDHPEAPRNAELLVLDTSDAHGSHRHSPYLSFLYDSRGSLDDLDEDRAPLRGWEDYVVGPDGRAITRLSLEGTRIKFGIESERTLEFERHSSMNRVPDLRRLGVTAINQPDSEGQIQGVTSRIRLPAGALFTSGEVLLDGKPAEWEGVGVVAEFTHLFLRGLTELKVRHGSNAFDLEPIDGVVELSISNEPTSIARPSFDERRRAMVVPHFHMFGRVASRVPELVRRVKEVTPGTPACPKSSWVQADWRFL